MAKKAAVLVVDPVNGAGLFHYLEAFFENGIPFRTFAVAETPQVTTNSGVALRLDDTVSRLAGREEEYDALVIRLRRRHAQIRRERRQALQPGDAPHHEALRRAG